MNAARHLLEEVRERRPDVYRDILDLIRPHSLAAMSAHFNEHLRRVPLDAFNRHRDAIPDFCLAFFRHARRPTPGDPFGIQITCRITQTDTQGTLDSKHLQQSSSSEASSKRFCAEPRILGQLAIFTTQQQVLELSRCNRYSTVFVRHATAEELLANIPGAGLLERGGERNKGRDASGAVHYLRMFQFIVVEDWNHVKVLYTSSKDVFTLLKHIPPGQVAGFSNVHYLYDKCGILSHFFNMVAVARFQLFKGDDPVYEKDMVTLIKYQCRSGRPLSLTREGLAKNPDRSPLEVLSFEAPKRNYARLCTTYPRRDEWHPVAASSDKIFFGQQFNEGTGYHFELRTPPPSTHPPLHPSRLP